MASRPVFIVTDTCPFVLEQSVEFKYYPGFALSQSQKSIKSLHQTFNQSANCSNINVLEVSSKSTELIGTQLSAFNLVYKLKCGNYYPLECVFQSSKVFEDMTQFADIIEKSPHEVKRDPRLKEHGAIIRFCLEDDVFPNCPHTYFYDWIYCNAVYQNSKLRKDILRYDAFTDIAFNPSKSINCQARSAAKYVGLARAGMLDFALQSKEDFLRIAYRHNTASLQTVQLRLDI